MKLLIVAATKLELGEFLDSFEVRETRNRLLHGQINGHDIACLITGIGSVATAVRLARQLTSADYDLVINAGIAGAFLGRQKIGDSILVGSEIFGDLGVEASDGDFLDLFDIGLVQPNESPYRDGKLYCNYIDLGVFDLPIVNGLTVNVVHGNEDSIKIVRSRYDVDIESMEGAAVFYTCLVFEVQCLELRSISNMVEIRNRDNWDLPLAIHNLQSSLHAILAKLQSRTREV